MPKGSHTPIDNFPRIAILSSLVSFGAGLNHPVRGDEWQLLRQRGVERYHQLPPF